MVNSRSLVAGAGTLISILLYIITRSSGLGGYGGYGLNSDAFPTANAVTDAYYASLAGTGYKPVEASYEGLNREQNQIFYTIKVNTVRKVERVELSVRYLDDAGRLVFEAPYVWRNEVKSKPSPIQPGKTYEVEDYLYPGATSADIRVLRLVFADHKTWVPN